MKITKLNAHVIMATREGQEDIEKSDRVLDIKPWFGAEQGFEMFLQVLPIEFEDIGITEEQFFLEFMQHIEQMPAIKECGSLVARLWGKDIDIVKTIADKKLTYGKEE